MDEAHHLTNVANFLTQNLFLKNLLISLGRVVPWDFLSLGTFCPLGRFVLGPYVLGRFVLGRFVPWDVLSWDVLSVHPSPT